MDSARRSAVSRSELPRALSQVNWPFMLNLVSPVHVLRARATASKAIEQSPQRTPIPRPALPPCGIFQYAPRTLYICLRAFCFEGWPAPIGQSGLLALFELCTLTGAGYANNEEGIHRGEVLEIG